MLLQYFTINNNPNKFITNSIYMKTHNSFCFMRRISATLTSSNIDNVICNKKTLNELYV